MSIVLQISADPALNKRFLSRTSEEQFKIPRDLNKKLKSLTKVSSLDKSILVSKITSPEDYQKQINLLALIQHSLDNVQEINTDLYMIQSAWDNLYEDAYCYLQQAYFDELDKLRDGVRKSVISTALRPISFGQTEIAMLVKLGEKAYSHLLSSHWNVRESNNIIKEYLTSLRSPTNATYQEI